MITSVSAKTYVSKTEISSISRFPSPSTPTSPLLLPYSQETKTHHLQAVIIFIWRRLGRLRSNHCRIFNIEGCERSWRRRPMWVSAICTSRGRTRLGRSFCGSGSVWGTVRKWCCRLGTGRGCRVFATVIPVCGCTRIRLIISLSVPDGGVEGRLGRGRIEPYSRSSIYIQFYTINTIAHYYAINQLIKSIIWIYYCFLKFVFHLTYYCSFLTYWLTDEINYCYVYLFNICYFPLLKDDFYFIIVSYIYLSWFIFNCSFLMN